MYCVLHQPACLAKTLECGTAYTPALRSIWHARRRTSHLGIPNISFVISYAENRMIVHYSMEF